MKKIRSLLAVVFMAVLALPTVPLTIPVVTGTAVVFTVGCKTRLAPGPYGGNVVLYNADKVIDAAYDAVHAFVTWEYENRDRLPPSVSKAANEVRLVAKKAIQSAIAVRDNYAKNPIQENHTALEAALEAVQAAIVEADKFKQAPK